MIRIAKIDSNTAELEVGYTQAGPTATLTFANVYGVEVATLNVFTYQNGKGKFRLTNDIHQLPFGRYNVTVATGTCVCGCFPVDILACEVASVVANQAVNDIACDDIPVRECDNSVPVDTICNPCDPCYTDYVSNFLGKVDPPVIVFAPSCPVIAPPVEECPCDPCGGPVCGSVCVILISIGNGQMRIILTDLADEFLLDSMMANLPANPNAQMVLNITQGNLTQGGPIPVSFPILQGANLGNLLLIKVSPLVYETVSSPQLVVGEATICNLEAS